MSTPLYFFSSLLQRSQRFGPVTVTLTHRYFTVTLPLPHFYYTITKIDLRFKDL